VFHCLEKRPEKRFQSSNDLSFALKTLADPAGANLSPPVQAPEATPIPVRGAGRERLGWIMAALLLLVVVALAIVHFRRAPVEARSVRSFILLPERSSLNITDSYASALAVSPDGRYLA